MRALSYFRKLLHNRRIENDKIRALKYALWVRRFMFGNCKAHCPVVDNCDGCPHNFKVMDSLILNIEHDGINEPKGDTNG